MTYATLAHYGLAAGDLVTYASDDESTGGVLFEISEHCDPVKPSMEGRMIRNSYGRVACDENGKKIPPMKVSGYVRLKPVFEFFPTDLGANPRGKGSTVLVYYNQLPLVKKVDLVSLASKYMELGNVVRDIALKGGMVDPAQGGQAPPTEG